MNTVRMLPPPNLHQQSIAINGRVYAGLPGSAFDVPDFDAGILAASGWTRVALSGPSSARPSTNPNVNPPYVAAPGTLFHDTTLSKLIIFEGNAWRDPATGNAV